MIKNELSIDNKGILYYDNSIIKNYPLSIAEEDKEFYQLPFMEDYIIKYSKDKLSYLKTKEMLLKFKDLQNKIDDIDFPIGYYKEHHHIKGLIIPYYPNSHSLEEIAKTKDLNKLKKYYCHDDDRVHNLYLLCLDILRLIEEMCDNYVFYTDVHCGNFLLHQNNIKVIDFEYKYIHFRDNIIDEHFKAILFWYESLVYKLTRDFCDYEIPYHHIKDIDRMRQHVLKIEKSVRRRI